jgi:hypothetical protein
MFSPQWQHLFSSLRAWFPMMLMPAVAAAVATAVAEVGCEPAVSMAGAHASPMCGVADTARREAVMASLAVVTATGRYQGAPWRAPQPPEEFIAMQPIAALRMVWVRQR